MGKKERRKFTEEFKREAVRQLELRGNRPASTVAESLGVGEAQLYQWRKKYRDTWEAALKERGETVEEEVKRLRREVKQLKEQQVILKKATTFFAKECDR